MIKWLRELMFKKALSPAELELYQLMDAYEKAENASFTPITFSQVIPEPKVIRQKKHLKLVHSVKVPEQRSCPVRTQLRLVK